MSRFSLFVMYSSCDALWWSERIKCYCVHLLVDCNCNLCVTDANTKQPSCLSVLGRYTPSTPLVAALLQFSCASSSSLHLLFLRWCLLKPHLTFLIFLLFTILIVLLGYLPPQISYRFLRLDTNVIVDCCSFCVQQLQLYCVHKKEASSIRVITFIWLFWYLLIFAHNYNDSCQLNN